MKTTKILILSFLSLLIIGSCEQSLEEPTLPSEQEIEIVPGKADMRHMPFKAKFFTIKDKDASGNGACIESPYILFNFQGGEDEKPGEGTGTHLGKFTTTMWFCGSNIDFTYVNGQGEFVAANGDKLYFEIPTGEVKWLIEPFPPYELYFKDQFFFTGGTGRFEGASGGGYTDSLVDLLDDGGIFIEEHRTDHTWKGTLILPKK